MREFEDNYGILKLNRTRKIERSDISTSKPKISLRDKIISYWNISRKKRYLSKVK